MKRTIKKLKIKSIFIDLGKLSIILFIIFLCINNIVPLFNPSSETIQENVNIEQLTTHQEKSNDADIIAIGNSDLYSALNPLQLWNEQGVTSYVEAAPKLNMRSSFYLLEESLKYYKPKLIILEVDQFFEAKYLDSKERDKEVASETIKPFLPQSSEGKKRRGYYYNTEIVPYKKGFSFMTPSEGRKKENKLTGTYLTQFVNLARRNDAQILFVCFPSASSWSYQKHNTVNDFAKKFNVPFLDLNTNLYNTSFDWTTDTRDAGNHLNYSGAKKMTKFIGEYIAKNYQLKDHRKDSKYNQWETDYQTFIKSISNQ